MDYLMNKFSVIRNEMKHKNQKKREDNRSLKQANENLGQILSLADISRLIELGFTFEQSNYTISTFKCTSIEQAVLIMTKDSMTGYYNHPYHEDRSGRFCLVCLDSRKDNHISPQIFSNNGVEIDNNKDALNDKEVKKDEYNKLSDISNMSNKPVNTLLDKPFILNEKSSLADKFRQENLPVKSHIFDEKYSLDYEDPELCEICWDNKVDNATQRRCQHKFCIPCVTSYLTNKINNGKVSFFFNYFILGFKIKMFIRRLSRCFY